MVISPYSAAVRAVDDAAFELGPDRVGIGRIPTINTDNHAMDGQLTCAIDRGLNHRRSIAPIGVLYGNPAVYAFR